jgi:SNF2 family DNA or RNA helicase
MDTTLRIPQGNGFRVVSVSLKEAGERIEFVRAPFAAKDEIKAMRGARWNPDRKIWSIENCPRNWFQLRCLQGENVYAAFDAAVQRRQYTRPLMPHQCDLADCGLTYHFQLWAAEMGTGKTLAAQEVIERSGVGPWLWVGPKTSLRNIEREFKRWQFAGCPDGIELCTYESLKKISYVPAGVIFDEGSRCKGPNTQRTIAAQELADAIRDKHGYAGYVILMSGTPAPKSPLDWWALAEIVWPGFLREGNIRALEQRLAWMKQETQNGSTFNKRVSWKDDEQKCCECGLTADAHDPILGDHVFKRSKNEVAYLYERLKGLVVVKHKKDCLSLPDKRYRQVVCNPSASLLRAAKAITATSLNAAGALTLLRELSDGFQYREVADGVAACNHCEATGQVAEWFGEDGKVYSSRVLDGLERREVACPVCHGDKQIPRMTRTVKEVPCPKDKALQDLLEECEETGRLVIFAGFTGSVDRCQRLCRGEGWDVVRCDGRGWQVQTWQGEILTVDPLDYWADKSKPRVAYVAHPESGGMSFTLVESRKAVFYSNTFKPEFRSQAEDRIHRQGADENVGVEIVDLVHLPSDQRVLEVLRDNRRLELMTLGELEHALAA